MLTEKLAADVASRVQQRLSEKNAFSVSDKLLFGIPLGLTALAQTMLGSQRAGEFAGGYNYPTENMEHVTKGLEDRSRNIDTSLKQLGRVQEADPANYPTQQDPARKLKNDKLRTDERLETLRPTPWYNTL